MPAGSTNLPQETRVKSSPILAAVLVLAPLVAPAQSDYPSRPVTLVVPFAAGGPSDKVARDLAEALRKPLGQTVIVENAAGAGGTIGTAKVAHAAPDGYTLLVHHIGMATTPALYRKLTFQIPGDFETLGLINEAPSVVIGKPQLDANNFAELRKWIASRGDKVTIANAGLGSASHLCGLMLQSALNAKMTPVPYKGTGPAMTDLIGGQVDLMCEQATNAVPMIEGKKVKAFAQTGPKRLPLPALKDVPTVAEAGLSNFNVQVWHGLYAPKGTPPAVLAKLNSALRTALKDPALIKREEALGLTVVTDDRLDPATHRKFLEAEMVRWGKVINAAGEYAD
jgi:tripartite-type tricarboxylate transporter receptor subunit TctC